MSARVMVVENNAGPRRHVMDVLARGGLDVVATDSPTSARAKARTERIDGAVLGGTSYEALDEYLRWIAEMRLPLSGPSVALGQLFGVRERLAIHASGVQDYLAWPTSDDMLLSVVRGLLGGTSAAERPAGARRLLVVDDSPTYANALIDALAKDGHDLAYAQGGTDALGFLTTRPIDLAIVDVFMTGMSGVDLCRQMKKDPRTAHIPVLVLTGREKSAVRDAASEAHADAFAVKSRDFDGILATVRGMKGPKAPGTPKSSPENQLEDRTKAPRTRASGTSDASDQGLFAQVVRATGLSPVLARSTVESVCRRLGLEPQTLTRRDVATVLPELARTLNLFLPASEAESRLGELERLAQ